MLRVWRFTGKEPQERARRGRGSESELGAQAKPLMAAGQALGRRQKLGMGVVKV